MPNYQGMAAAYAQKYGVPTQLFLHQISQESGFNPTAKSGAGALGIAQFMPATARSMGVDPMNPSSALDGAARLMSQSYKKYGSWEQALSVYNSGRPDAYKDPNFANGQTYNYVKNIMGGAGNLKASPTASAAPPTAPAMGGGGTAGAQQALAAMMLQQSSMTASGQPDSNSLLAMAMARQQLQAAQQVYGAAPQPGGTPNSQPGAVGGGKHVAPVAQDYKFGRIDQGVDISQSSPYVSPGAGTVVRIGKVAGGTNLGVYVKLDHAVSVNGRNYPGIYVWHTSPLVKPGQRVQAGQPIMSPGSAEVGFATANGSPVAPLVGGLGEGTKPTSPGQDMLSFFKSIYG